MLKKRITLSWRALVLTLGIAGAAGAAPLHGQTPVDVVWDQLKVAAEEMVAEGYFNMYYFVSFLGQDEEQTWSVPLVAGAEYLVVGACDPDCSDLDLDIARNGSSVDADAAADDMPIVVVEQAETGEYEVTATMYECIAEPCFYGFVVLARAP